MFLSKAVNAFKHYFSVGTYYAKLAIQRQVEYPLFLVTWFVFNFLQWFGWYFFIKVLAFRFDGIAGWAFPELLFLFSLSLISHGLVVIFFVQTWNIGRMIIKGEFDLILLKPMDSFFLFMVRNVNFIGIADLLPGIIIFFYSCHLLQVHFTALHAIKIVVVILGGTLIRTSLFLIANSSAFWNMNRDRLSGVTLKVIESCSMYPITIYPYFFQVVLTYFLPMAFICYFPSMELLGKGDSIVSYSLVALLIGFLMFSAGYKLFSFGIKQYESTGN